MTVKGMIIKIKMVIAGNISKGNVNSIGHGAQYLDVLEQQYGHLFE